MKAARDIKSHLKTVQRDIQSLTDHSTFLSGKIGFLLDAILGMLSIEQNAIIKIFSVAAVVFLPPTLIASIYGMNFKYLPEFDWAYGYPMALAMMLVSAISAVRLFQVERLAVDGPRQAHSAASLLARRPRRNASLRYCPV